VTLITALGADDLGEQAAKLIATLDLGTSLLQTTTRFPTGTAQVRLGNGGRTEFKILRPAAYDAVDLSAGDLSFLQQRPPGWFYYGTLFASSDQGKKVLKQILTLLCDSVMFYDLNLRPGSDSPELVRELLQSADVVKFNEDELHRVHEFTGLPLDVKAFCVEGMARFGWHAVGVTLGNRGCAILANGQFVEAPGHPVDVADTVGAGDAFAAAFMHGLGQNWPTAEIASFANRIGALVASRHGAIPDWTLEEAIRL
jgi:fructokinase